MRYLGIDYGAKRVGLALSDEQADFSYPLIVLDNTENLVGDIVKICKDNGVVGVVVGESLDFAQKENEIMKDVTPFVEKLKKSVNIPVHMHPEFMTSMEAERLQGSNNMNDASAAALILKSFLEKKK